MTSFEEKTEDKLAYSGFVLFAFELVKSMIVLPIKIFYKDTTFGDGMPFKTYEEDVMSRHKNPFEASLLYLRDFMEALDSEGVLTIQALRKHRNDIAHGLPQMLGSLDITEYIPLLEKTDKVLFKLSNYRAYMKIGAEPALQNEDIDWDTVKGIEYLLFEEVLKNIKILPCART